MQDKILHITVGDVPAELTWTSVFLASKVLNGVEFRANNIESFDNLEKNSMDFYASLKSLYLQDRQLKIENIKRGNIQIIYNDEGDWEEIDTK